MTLIKFKEQNTTFAESQPEYLPLPAYKFKDDPAGRIVCCWQFTWKERFKLLIGGKMWHQILTFNQPLQPQLLSGEKPEMPI